MGNGIFWSEIGSMSDSIEVKTTFVGDTTYKTLTEQVNTFVVILPNDSSGGRHFQVLCKMFSLSQIPKIVQLSTGKNSAKCNALNQCLCCDFCRSTAGGFQIAIPT